ncbi:DUF445 domain-containing protein [Paenibacillus physcomitrellae]|uniref:DUF445 domain-containing protein n=1 Tax=Paenibacillus physcomitrellae TaxID=1619311 RepID=A0ABQ1GD36_9BACL|nr:DUF445 domain-containing protein [Paenibacillus physcomitrellae]GGA41303.1 DUF445 domain-containing protein [Paenibacillus physcomitrellae]
MMMRRKANLSLLLLALLFAAALACLYLFPEHGWPQFLLYVAEAGLVGALADLFAITALFRHPLGLNILPHTAIIPKNRDKLVDGVVVMVEEQLLSKPVLKEKVQQYHLIDLAVSMVERGGSQKMLAEQIWSLVLAFAKQANVQGLAVKLDEQLRSSLQAADLSPYAGRGLRWLLDHTQFQSLLTQLVDLAAERLAHDGVKQQIKELLSKEKEQLLNTGGTFTKWLKKSLLEIAESSNAFNLDDAAEVLYDDLRRFLVELRSPEHELRKLTTEMLYKLASELEKREELSDTLNVWKNELLDKISLLPSLTALLTHVRDRLLSEQPLVTAASAGGGISSDQIKQFMTRFVLGYWDWFKDDRELKDWLEGYVQQFVRNMIDTEHALVGQIVRTTLNDFTEERLTEFIESKVDTDLQRIRLNGALVGAALGAAFYLLLNGVYKPLLDWFGV